MSGFNLNNGGFATDNHWVKVKPKWTIYNNTLPWSQLSDKQKGKMLLASHEKILFCNFGNLKPSFELHNEVYKAVVPKPAPTMAELFLTDWSECLEINGTVEHMINRGWTKPCK